MEHKRKTASDAICESFYSASNLCPSRSDLGKNRASGKLTWASSGIPSGTGPRSGTGTGTGTGSGGKKYREIADTDIARSGRCSPIECLVDMTIDSYSNSLGRNSKSSTGERDSEKEKEKGIERKEDPYDGVLRFREYVAATMMKRIPVTDERLSLCFEILDIGT